MTDGHVTNPQTRRTRTRRTKKSKVYQSPEWKARVAGFVKGKECEWCGAKTKLLAHHPYRDTPDSIYQDLYLSGCIILCQTCHFMFHRRHKKKCPVCREHWMDLDVDRCYTCHLKENPGLAEKIQEEKDRQEWDRTVRLKLVAARRRALKAKHPCRLHRIGGVCGLSAISARCPYAPTKALAQCGDAIAKGVKA